ncbi:MAG: hypothetical protein WA842_12775 [Croceibacterium sp.]
MNGQAKGHSALCPVIQHQLAQATMFSSQLVQWQADLRPGISEQIYLQLIINVFPTVSRNGVQSARVIWISRSSAQILFRFAIENRQFAKFNGHTAIAVAYEQR